ncbi:unnamed protein product [Phytophthora lilii]|uniref:Unnamed protein product n=1 Tax=Phytophthora lilii TaxID=2077276 RepID=A0A9W6U7P0_9STRA|nr:unnamed protein product [Phytophthora lilii]
MAQTQTPERRKLSVRELLELERQIYQESIDRVLQQQELLKRCELEDFVRRCRPFELDRERELEVARAQYQFSKRDASSLQDFDLQQAEDVFRTDRQQLKRKLLERARRRRLKIEKRLKALDDDDTPPPTSNLKQRTRHDVDAVNGHFEPKLLKQQLRRAQRRTRKNFNFRHLTGGVLPTPERIVKDVMTECEKLQHNREQDEMLKVAGEEGVASKMQVTITEDGKVICSGEGEDMTFTVGDAVVLTSRLTEEDFYGFVSVISKDEVRLVLVCGTHVRVAFARLRSGQCTLEKQHNAVVPVLKHENGQDNHEMSGSKPVATNLEELLRDPPDVRRRAAAVMSTLRFCCSFVFGAHHTDLCCLQID